MELNTSPGKKKQKVVGGGFVASSRESIMTRHTLHLGQQPPCIFPVFFLLHGFSHVISLASFSFH